MHSTTKRPSILAADTNKPNDSETNNNAESNNREQNDIHSNLTGIILQT